MKTVFLAATMFVFCLTNATGQGKLLTSDPLTGLPLIPATDSSMHLGNKPTQMPDGQICKSKFQGNFYSLFNIKVDAAAAWYSSHLSGFKKVSGYESQRSQTAFHNSDGTTVVIVAGDSGAQGENTNAYSVAINAISPASPRKRSISLTRGKTICQ